MKTVILAGGLGTRLAEETEVRPKPMVEVGGRPLLWHILKHYGAYGHNEFVVALGYKGEHIKRFFLDLAAAHGSLTVDLETRDVRSWDAGHEPWKLHLVETGLHTMTGGRVLALREQLQERFFLTYGDGVANIDLAALLEHHEKSGCVATITAVRPPARFGALEIDDGRVTAFKEKPQVGEGWINGGFMVFEPEVFDHMERGPETVLERDVLEKLAREHQLAAYQHDGFWQCMDTLREKRLLEELWSGDAPPWKVWT